MWEAHCHHGYCAHLQTDGQGLRCGQVHYVVFLGTLPPTVPLPTPLYKVNAEGNLVLDYHPIQLETEIHLCMYSKSF